MTKLNPTGSALVYSTYLGGSGAEYLENDAIVVDAAGNAYVAGWTESSDFPTTPGAVQRTYAGRTSHLLGGDAFVTKLNPTGSALVYSTYLGGSSSEMGTAIAVDAAGSAYVTGPTASSSDFPTTPGAFQETQTGYGNSFVTKLNPTGSALVYSTYLGGSGSTGAVSYGIAVDTAGNAYVTGVFLPAWYVPNFPTTPGAVQTTYGGGFGDAFVTKLNPTGSALVYSTYLGGSGPEYWENGAIAVDAAGNAYVAGRTASSDFPTTPGAFQTTHGGGGDAFVTKLNPTGSALVYSTYLGGSGPEMGTAIAVDAAGNAYAAGMTYSTDFPTTLGAFQRTLYGDSDTFVARFAFNALPLSVSSITPGTGGDTGPVSVTIFGGGYVSGTTVKLVRAGQPDIVGDPVTVGANGVSLTTTFDLTGKVRGVWDVVVSNPDGSSATLPGGFTIEEGRAPQLWVDIIGRDTIRVGREQTYIIRYGNRGNVDAFAAPLWIGGIPADATWKLNSELTLPSGEGLENIDWTQIPIAINRTDETLLPLLISRVPAGFTGTLKFSVTPQSATAFTLRTWIDPPLLSADYTLSGPQASAIVNALSFQFTSGCMAALATLTFDVLGLPFPVLGSIHCAVQIASYIAGQISATATATSDPSIFSGIQVFAAYIGGALRFTAKECLVDVTPVMNAIAGAVVVALDLVRVRMDCFGVLDERDQSPLPVTPVASYDPNDKIGSRGAGESQYIAGDVPLLYAIFFENQETATAPAQEVVITDQLDPATMDLATLSLGPITFGDWEITPPPGLTEYTTEVDLRPDQELIVRIHARLDPETSLLTWRFTSIDPATGQLPEDPLAGFLPPNVNPPEGDGSVLFTVQPKANLPTGTEVRNQATIIFDVNAPILTPVWLNTLDNSKPQSQVLPLVATQSSPTFPVQWTGTDEGAGIKDFSLFVSEDGGPVTPWLLNTPDTSAIFTGQLGHQYAFSSIARDQAGNLEAPLPIADASTATPPGPDLTGTWNPVSVSCRRGQCSLRGSVLVRNQGSASAPASFLRVYVSDDAVLGPEDSMLLETSVRALPPGGSRAGRVRVRLPLGVSTTGKYLFAVLDPSHSVAETEEGNNTLRYGPLP